MNLSFRRMYQHIRKRHLDICKCKTEDVVASGKEYGFTWTKERLALYKEQNKNLLDQLTLDMDEEVADPPVEVDR